MAEDEKDRRANVSIIAIMMSTRGRGRPNEEGLVMTQEDTPDKNTNDYKQRE